MPLNIQVIKVCKFRPLYMCGECGYTKNMDELKSEKIVLSSPLSFIGSALRIWKVADVGNIFTRLLLIPVAVIFMLCAWMFVAFWYFIIYVLFGILFIPYRLLRRGSRKQKQERLRHREILDAIKNRNL